MNCDQFNTEIFNKMGVVDSWTSLTMNDNNLRPDDATNLLNCLTTSKLTSVETLVFSGWMLYPEPDTTMDADVVDLFTNSFTNELKTLEF